MNGTMNKVTLIVNLGDDVKIHKFDDLNIVGRFPIATTESFTSKESGEKVTQTEWHNIVVRNKLAEICEKYLNKGDKVFVEGRLKTRKWQDQNGQDRYTTEIMANEVIFMSQKSGGSDDSNSQMTNDAQSSYSSSKQDPPTSSSMSMNEEPDDLPF